MDGAVHSAKDLPPIPREGLDWFWLDSREDPRDVLVWREGEARPSSGIVGVSSVRRETYCTGHFPGLEQRALRGTMEERLAQLDAGKIDLMVTAAAAMHRLGWAHRICEYIPAEELAPPEAQGVLAVTFRRGDLRFEEIRRYYVPAVRFAGSGPGREGLCTVEAREELENCDVCLYDALVDPALLRHAGGALLYTGKREGRHSMKQEEISHLILDEARKGRRVLRLKGGDPGLFGRLSEEVDMMEAYGIPYRVIPGVSSMNAATSATGLLLTKRASHRGFCALTPRQRDGGSGSAGSELRKDLPIVLFMSVRTAESVFAELIEEGRSPDEAAAVIFDAGSPAPRILKGSLSTLPDLIRDNPDEAPGLIIVGEPASLGFSSPGALKGMRVLLTSSPALSETGRRKVLDFGGIPLVQPLIRLERTECALDDLDRFDWICLSSPSGARFFLDALKDIQKDLRTIPPVMVCGKRTAAPLEEAGIYPDLCPDAFFSAKGLLEALPAAGRGEHVLKLDSDRAGRELADGLEAKGYILTRRILYRNSPAEGGSLSPAEAVVLASRSAAETYAARSGNMEEPQFAVIGEPTRRRLEELGGLHILPAPEATMEDCICALALYNINKKLKELCDGIS